MQAPDLMGRVQEGMVIRAGAQGVKAGGHRVARCLVPMSRRVASAWCPAWSCDSGWPQPDCSMDLSGAS